MNYFEDWKAACLAPSRPPPAGQSWSCMLTSIFAPQTHYISNKHKNIRAAEVVKVESKIWMRHHSFLPLCYTGGKSLFHSFFHCLPLLICYASFSLLGLSWDRLTVLLFSVLTRRKFVCLVNKAVCGQNGGVYPTWTKQRASTAFLYRYVFNWPVKVFSYAFLLSLISVFKCECSNL